MNMAIQQFAFPIAQLQPGPTLLGVDLIWAATLLAGVAALSVFVAVYAAATVRDPMAKRVKALNERREQLKAGIIAPQGKRRAKLNQKNATTDKVRGFLDSFKLLQDTQVKDAQKKLAQAGIRSKDGAFIIILSRLVLPVVIGGGMCLYIFGFDGFADYSPLKRFGIAAISLIGSYKAADLWLANKISKRATELRKGLPDGLDLLVICAEAGLTVDAAFARVARELGKAYPELGDEFMLTSIELGFLTDRKMAFANLANRVDLPSVKGVVTTMIQTEKYGTPLAAALRVLSAEFRNERMMRAEEKAARLPAIMTVPLILFILPVLFVVIIGPAACSISDTLGSK
jgi:tight adherence protein C